MSWVLTKNGSEEPFSGYIYLRAEALFTRRFAQLLHLVLQIQHPEHSLGFQVGISSFELLTHLALLLNVSAGTEPSNDMAINGTARQGPETSGTSHPCL